MNTTTSTSSTTQAAVAKAADRERVTSVELVAAAEQGRHHIAVIVVTYAGGTVQRNVITDGETFFSAPVGEGKALQRKLAAMVSEANEDDEIRPTLTKLIDAVKPEQTTALQVPEPTSIAVGDVVYVHGMNRYRRGQVVKVGPKRVTVAFTTASSEGRIFRKAVAKDDVRVSAFDVAVVEQPKRQADAKPEQSKADALRAYAERKPVNPHGDELVDGATYAVLYVDNLRTGDAHVSAIVDGAQARGMLERSAEPRRLRFRRMD